jgi:hypothetical protein
LQARRSAFSDSGYTSGVVRCFSIRQPRTRSSTGPASTATAELELAAEEAGELRGDGGEERVADIGARAAEVAEHARLADRPDALGEEPLEPAGLGGRVALDAVEGADLPGEGGEHHARLEPAGVDVGVRHRETRRPRRREQQVEEAGQVGVAREPGLAAPRADRLADEAEVAAVPAEERELAHTRPLEPLERGEDVAEVGLGRHRDGAGEAEMVRREPGAGDRRDQHRTGQQLGDVVRDALRDQRVGGERQVRPVLLERRERDEADGAAGAEAPGLGPRQRLERHVRHCGNRSSTGTKSMS